MPPYKVPFARRHAFIPGPRFFRDLSHGRLRQEEVICPAAKKARKAAKASAKRA